MHGILISFLKKSRKPVAYVLLIMGFVTSFHFSTFFVSCLGKFQFDSYVEIFQIKVNLVAGFFFPLLATVIFLYLLLDLRESASYVAFATFSLLFMTIIVYSIRSETNEMVMFDPETMLFLSVTSLLLGMVVFWRKRPVTVIPNTRFLRRILFYPSGIMWLSAFIAELIILFRWHNERGLVERIDYMVLGGAGFNDVLAFYGLVTAFSAILFFVLLSLISAFFRNLLIRMAKVVIYRDIKYPSSWIDNDFSLRIANLSGRLSARIVNAEQLRTFMTESINQKNSHLGLVVFSQDVVPETILEDYYSTNTLREFLDSGGSVLWIGDIPLFYAGRYNREFREPFSWHIWRSGAPLRILGLTHVYSNPKSTVHITDLGYEIGLQRKWSGIRPIVRDKFIKPLAYSENLNLRTYTDFPPYRSLLRRFWNFLRRIKSVGTKGIEFYGPSEETEKKKEETIQERQFHKTHLNAWIKNFNPKYPFSGFYRIWDYNPRNITNDMIEEICEVVEMIRSRLADQF